jgi:hypothetical protein
MMSRHRDTPIGCTVQELLHLKYPLWPQTSINQPNCVVLYQLTLRCTESSFSFEYWSVLSPTCTLHKYPIHMLSRSTMSFKCGKFERYELLWHPIGKVHDADNRCHASWSAVDHTASKKQDPIRTPPRSDARPGQYWAGGPPGNTKELTASKFRMAPDSQWLFGPREASRRRPKVCMKRPIRLIL